MAPLIQLERVDRTYRMGEVLVPALRQVSLQIEAGEFVAIMGASGSGKSTLMNIVGCLDRPTSGRYLLAGEEVGRLSRDELARIRNRTVGFVFQHFNLLPRTSALENAELPLLYANLPAQERRQRALEALRRVGLADRAGHAPNRLSGGEQQRVAIARAIINHPLLVLADEPTGALDTRTSLEVMALFQELNRGGITIVLVTHEADIGRCAGRQLTMRDGRIIADVRQAPALLGAPEGWGAHP
ncbi:MAG: Macrolide export ATP-binding/permease protein MacB [Myxococcaceae bacterium]|nr:Macrolide export ATP-binding/permease protein MacB [Myxococcaceae bacterium]